MKYLLIIIISLLTIYLFGQIEFELDFSFDKIESNDILVDLWFDDLNSDGISEILATFRNYPISWMLVQYDQNGSILTVRNEDLPEEYNFGKGTIFNMDGTNYLAVAYGYKTWDTYPYTWINYLHLKIYDWGTFTLVDSTSYEFGYYGEGNGTTFYTEFIEPVEFQNEQFLYLGLQRTEHYDGDEQTYANTELHKYSFNNSTLTLVEENDLSGYSIKEIENFSNLISIDYYKSHVSYGGGISFSENVSYSLNTFPFYSPINITEVLQIDGSRNEISWTHYPSNICFLNNNDNNYNDYGLMFYYKSRYSSYVYTVNFLNFAPDLSDTLWTNSETHIGFDNISVSTCVTVNNEDHYVMYFRENNLEIRNRINGDILYHQNSTINPISILRKLNGDLVFITEKEDETGYNVYTLVGDIQVSADYNQIEIYNNDLINYPNPFNPSTIISFSIPEESSVEINIFNIKGQKIKSLVQESLNSGYHSVIWNGDDDFGKSICSGIYIYKLNVNGKIEAVKKCLLLK
ncbi:MAG: hypothetical protein DRJ01_08200 [Bacteroidetes bacterium]|nr:MAG: hypothetical protein DRJ01_08200 [Bacteroidota bacterium]